MTPGAAGPASGTRILQAARTESTGRGHDRTSARGIARAADAGAALVPHRFGTKDEVFTAAAEVSFEPAILDGPRRTWGSGRPAVSSACGRTRCPGRHCRRSSVPG
ncbi:TetR family transcriptional regulator [Streptomyces sp. NPDC014623]|uniref:TetR family transcriptional regulator n=1 Tax=Streptomyces sp. NPDC014623 TaxID=3364875 RepID=UPI0036FFE2B5